MFEAVAAALCANDDFAPEEERRSICAERAGWAGSPPRATRRATRIAARAGAVEGPAGRLHHGVAMRRRCAVNSTNRNTGLLFNFDT